VNDEVNSGNGTSALAKLLNQLNLPTLGLILLMGGGNWFTTKATSDEQRGEIHKAVRQINDLHESISEFEGRQKDEIGKATESLNNQSQMLRNQTNMLNNQMAILKQFKKPE
jgi:ABC-type oligopeptide transport system ATPase subunit